MTTTPTTASSYAASPRPAWPPTSTRSPPCSVQGLTIGRDAVLADWIEGGYPEITGLRGVPTAVNRQPAVGYYVWHDQESAYLPLSIDVLRVSNSSITEVTIFGPEQFAHLGLPETLPADGAR